MDTEVNAFEPVAARPEAPALEKGLDLLEALAGTATGLTQAELARQVGRSVGEIFRMLATLERRGYVTRDGRSGEYSLSLRLFQLAAQHPPARRMQQAALPVMEALAAQLGQSCHLGMVHGEHFIIVAQAEAGTPMGWVVRLGAVFPCSARYVSARVLAAFQGERRRGELAALLARQDGSALGDVLARLDHIAAAGYDMAPSEVVVGLTDISCPVLDHDGQAVAALTVPFFPGLGQPADLSVPLAALREAAATISRKLGNPPERDEPADGHVPERAQRRPARGRTMD